MAPGERKCADCGCTQFVEDHAQGDIVCKECGLVAEAHVIDERSEWRTFSDKDKESTDPNRVGGPNNPLLEGGGLSTVIARGQGDGSSTLNRLHTRNNNPDKALMGAFRQLGELSDKLRLTGDSVKRTACELYKSAMESGRLRGRSTAAICAACLYLACRQNLTPRSFKEITSIMPSEIRKKDISACFKEVLALQKDLGKGKDQSQLAYLAPTAQHPADYMKRFTAELRLDFPMFRACQDMALAAKPKEETNGSEIQAWDARAPLSVAAAILYILTIIKPDRSVTNGKPQPPVSIQDVVLATGVAEGTIRQVYRDLYSSLPRLLPAGFNSPQQIARLPGLNTPSAFPTTGASGPPLFSTYKGSLP